MSQEHSPATLSRDEIERFRRGDILLSDEQANRFCDLALSALSEIADSPAAKNEGNAALRLLAEVADAMDLSLGDSVSVAKMRPLVLARLESTPSATPRSWRTIESVPVGKMILLWHRAWRHPWAGQVIDKGTGECVLDTPTPEHKVAPHFASHWQALDTEGPR